MVALGGFWMRRSLPETLPPDANAPSLHSPAELGAAMVWRLRQILRHWRQVVLVIGLVSYANVVFYLAFVYLVDHTGQQLGNSAAANTVSTLLQTLGLPLVLLGGHLADRWGLVRANRWGNLALCWWLRRRC